MLNRSGIAKTTAVAPTQILGDVDFQFSIGCILANTGVTAGADGKKIVKAGTPAKVDPSNLQTPATVIASHDNINDANVIILHDVDVTNGNANATGLVMGIVNYNRLDTATQALLMPGDAVSGVFCIAL